MIRRYLPALALVVASSTLLRGAHAQPPMPGMGADGRPRKAKVVRKDLPYISCGVCKVAMEEVWAIAEQMRETAPYHKVGEEEFQELTFNVCDPDLDEGEWITMYDVVQHIPGSGNDEEDGGDLDEDSEEAIAAAAGSTAGGRIAVEKQEYVGECRRECRTIQRACNNVLEEFREDLAELLWKRTPDTLEKLSSRVCTKWAKVCPATKVPPTHERPFDEPWFPLDEDSYKMKRMQSQINRMTEKHSQRPVQFVDPFDDMFGTLREGDDEDDGAGDYWSQMMESMGGGGMDDMDGMPDMGELGGEL